MDFQLKILDGGVPRPMTTADLLAGGTPMLTPIGVDPVAITVGTSAAELIDLMAAVGGATINAACTWLQLRIRDGQSAPADTAVVKLNYAGVASATVYDAVMTRDVSRSEPDALIGEGNKALFDSYNLIASASTVVLVRQFSG